MPDEPGEWLGGPNGQRCHDLAAADIPSWYVAAWSSGLAGNTGNTGPQDHRREVLALSRPSAPRRRKLVTSGQLACASGRAQMSTVRLVLSDRSWPTAGT